MLFACSAETPSAPLPLDVVPQANAVAACDVLPGLATNAAAWYPSLDRYDVQGLIARLQTSCGAGNQTQTTAIAWQLLEIMEFVLDRNREGPASIGNLVAGPLLACVISLCDSSQLPAIDFAPSLSHEGLFAIRRTGTQPAVARDATPFIDFEGLANAALWGVEVDLPWSQVTGTNPVLVYGLPGGPTLPLSDVGIGGLQYDLNVFPDAGEFVDGALHVSVCFSALVTLPIVGGLDAGPRMQRENVLLEDHQPSFCPLSSIQSASLFGPVASLVRRILPSSRSSALFATRIGVIGGTPLDFSRFSPVAANVSGYLEFVQGPNPIVIEGQPIGDILVRARSGAGTPMEKVLITLTLVTNNGVPAGAVLSGDVASYSEERNGEEGVASFPDDGLPPSVGKPGGYRLCATGELAGYTFPTICSDRFHGRNFNDRK
jgi:hypothetical protein